MTKDEMKNRISMALKDPILQQGFEIICKNLTEQEEKIADIKANCDLAIEGRDVKIKELELELTVQKDQLQEETNLHLHAEEYIKSLEKENAELESNFRICEKNADTYYDQLTKAKEHIKRLLDCLKQDTNDPQTNYYVCQYMDKAEQFIREIE